MIYLFTGTPGAGKTSMALKKALAFHKEGRTVYAWNVKGLDYVKAGFLPLDDATKWEELPDNSVVVFDEAYEAFPQRDYRKPLPEFIKRLATHRHRGFDLIFICQQGSQIDVEVRRQVGEHFHVKRKTQKRSLVLKWDRYEEKPNEFVKQMSAQKSVQPLPKEVWPLYTSATMHTHKTKLPWQVAALFILIPLVVFGVWKGVYGFTHDDPAPTQAAPLEGEAGKGEAPAAPVGAAPPSSDRPVQTVLEWIAEREPRVEGMPWTAPIYDGREVVEVPIPLCIESPGRCRCWSQQMTKLDVPLDMCMRIVRDGLFDPYRRAFHFTNESSTSEG